MNAYIQWYEAEEKKRPQIYDAAVQMMDDDIRECLHHLTLTEGDFLARYCREHMAKYNEEFLI